MIDAETIRLYDARAGDYAQANPSDTPDATLSAFIAALPDGARVLDLGCGPGRAAGHMADAGLTVEAWDASEAMIALADRHPDVVTRLADFEALDAEAAYAGIWANFSLLHAPRAAMPGHLAAIRRALTPGGIAHLGLKEGTGSKRDTLGRLYTYYTEQELSALMLEAGLSPGRFERGTDKGLDGVIAPWFTVTAHA